MDFLKKADALWPHLFKTKHLPLEKTEPVGRYMRSGDNFTLDFGTHLVGQFHMVVEPDNTPDSPLQVDFLFAEMPFELDDYVYTGGLSSTWIQRETVYYDVIPEEIILPRRYAFRYVKVTFPGNTAYKVCYKQSYCIAVTSADEKNIQPLPADTDDLLKRIDEVALRTLRNCMQSVFEDGPKRDRRLWLGDLYLQAKANFYTYNNYDLVKRCLYLFAGLPHADGCLSSAVYPEPVLRNQSWIIHDYALFFIGVLYDCYEAYGDRELVKELWPVALRQAEIAIAGLDDTGLIKPENYFIDWCDGLNKVAAGQGVLICMLRQALALAEILGESHNADYLRAEIDKATVAAMSLYDEAIGLFACGPEKQISRASQMWMILADVFDKEKNCRIIDNLVKSENAIATVTPYAMHYYIEALIKCGKKDDAMALIRDYWGGMVSGGADCFWEVYIPGEPEASPYNSHRINSYCHAWSCTPTYFIRKYFI